MNYGIDYGMGTTNVGANDIRFGVIPINSLHDCFWEELESQYGDPTCPKCDNVATAPEDAPDDDHEEGFEPYRNRGCCGDHYCLDCKIYFDSEDAFGDEPLGYTLDDNGIVGESSDGIDLFVTSSPYYTHAEYCSPCAPGACYLLNPVDKQGPRAFCLPHEYFESGKAPYPVFRVSDGSLVKPER